MATPQHLVALLSLLVIAGCADEAGITAQGLGTSSGVEAGDMADNIRRNAELRDRMIEDLMTRVRMTNAPLEDLRARLGSQSGATSEAQRKDFQELGLKLGQARKAALDKVAELRSVSLERVERMRRDVDAITGFLDNEVARARQMLAGE